MPRSNPSHASFSSAASASFRLQRLKRANIRFLSTHANVELPVSVTNIVALLSDWPQDVGAVNLAGTDSAIYDGNAELKEAVEASQYLQDEEIEACQLQHERVWMRTVNEIALRTLIVAKAKREISSTEDYLWTEGRHLSSSACESLHDPKPDFAFGLQPPVDLASTPGVFSMNTLDKLKDSSRVALVYSPSQMEDIVYPSVIFEAKSDKNPILWAENQVAVGSARALGLLRELSELSGIHFRHCVIAIVSAGPEWKFFVAYLDEHGGMNLLPILDRPLWIGQSRDRVRIAFILRRVKSWIVGPYKDMVRSQIEEVWRTSGLT